MHHTASRYLTARTAELAAGRALSQDQAVTLLKSPAPSSPKATHGPAVLIGLDRSCGR